MTSVRKGAMPLTVSLQDVDVRMITARSPPLPHLVSLPPSDIMVGGAFGIALVAVFWPASLKDNYTLLMAGLSAALDGYPIFVGRLQSGGKVGSVIYVAVWKLPFLQPHHPHFCRLSEDFCVTNLCLHCLIQCLRQTEDKVQVTM